MNFTKNWSVRAVIVGVALAAAAGGALAPGRPLSVVSWGGAYQDAQKVVYFKPFMDKTGVKLVDESWDGGIGVLRAKMQGGANNWDVVQVESEELLLGCEEGLFEKLDWAKLGGKDKFLKDAVNDCGVGAIVYNFVLGYDGDKIKAAPKGWADFWDVKKYPGKRALRKGPKTNLEIALIADGVPAKDVYKVLRTPEGIERAFKKLDTIKPDLVFWKAGAQPPQFLSTHPANSTRIRDLEKHMPESVSWTKPNGGFQLWVTLPKGFSSVELFLRSVEKGAAFLPGPLQDINNRFMNSFRLCYGSLSPNEITEGIRRLAEAVREYLAETPGDAGMAGLGDF